MAIVLEAKNLTKEFKRFVAVDDVSFYLREGEILGLLGRNGAGKTTLIQMLLSVLTPTRGDIFYFGKDLKKHREEILERVNFSSAYTNLPLDLTVKENLIYNSYLYDIKNRKKRIAEIIKVFQLEELLKQPTKEISSGQTTKLNLAKAFINYPAVLLLDEPTVSLDPEVAAQIRRIIVKEQKEFRVSTILTSHNMAEIQEMCDRVIFINHGKIIADDRPQALARSIKISHVRLQVGEKLEQAAAFSRENNFTHRIDGNCLVVDLPEEKIPQFLNGLMSKNISYTEISIEKPTLEDYFMQVVAR